MIPYNLEDYVHLPLRIWRKGKVCFLCKGLERALLHGVLRDPGSLFLIIIIPSLHMWVEKVTREKWKKGHLATVCYERKISVRCSTLLLSSLVDGHTSWKAQKLWEVGMQTLGSYVPNKSFFLMLWKKYKMNIGSKVVYQPWYSTKDSQ
jgi:hypothetical protein